MRLSDAARNASCDAIVDRLDAGSGNGKLEIYSGPYPGSVSTPPSGSNVKLATCTFSKPAFGNAGAVTPGMAVANPISPATGAVGGTATWFRATDSDNNIIFDGTVADDLEIDDIAIISGGTVRLNSMTYSVPTASC